MVPMGTELIERLRPDLKKDRIAMNQEF